MPPWLAAVPSGARCNQMPFRAMIAARPTISGNSPSAKLADAMGARHQAPYPPFGTGPGTNPFFSTRASQGFPTILGSGITSEMKRLDPETKARAVAIEYWLATFLVSGAFVAGLIAGLPYLLDG